MKVLSANYLVKTIILSLFVVLLGSLSVSAAQLTIQGRVPANIEIYFSQVFTPPAGGYDLTANGSATIAETTHRSNRKNYSIYIYSTNGGVLIHSDPGVTAPSVPYYVTYGSLTELQITATGPGDQITAYTDPNRTPNEGIVFPFAVNWDGVPTYPAGTYSDTVVVTISLN